MHRQSDTGDAVTAPAHDLGADYDLLVVEDNPGDVRLLEEAFERYDRDLRAVTDGQTARDLLSAIRNGTEPRPRLILMDLDLPGVSGVELLEHIDRVGGPQIPVVVITDALSDEAVSEAYAANANAFLVKPTDYDSYADLVEAIERFWLRAVRLPDER